MDNLKKGIEYRLKHIDFHANWNLANTVKSYASLKQSIEEHLQNSPSIEAYFFKSYLCVSPIRGTGSKDIKEAITNNDKAAAMINEIKKEPIRDGYESIYLAMCCWLALERDKIPSEELEKVEKLVKKYKAGKDQTMFKASIHASKGFAFARLSFGRYNESLIELKSATDACPENVDWLFMFGLLKWRLSNYGLGKNFTSPEHNDVEGIMNKVLNLRAEHAYAMVILADIKRRKYEQKNFDSGIIEVSHITNLLQSSTKYASRPKILSLVAQCFIRLGSACHKKENSENTEASNYFSEARKIIDEAKQHFNSVACIVSQEAVLYRELNNTTQELKCLDEAIKMDQSNMGSYLQKATALRHTGRHQEELEIYDNLPSNVKDYPFAYFQMNLAFAKCWIDRKQYDKAVSTKVKCLEIALESFVKNSTIEKIEFLDGQNKQVQDVIKYLKKHWGIKRKNDPQDIRPKQELAELHEHLHEYKNACLYYQEALGVLLQTKTNYRPIQRQEINIRIGLTNATLKSGSFDIATTMLKFFDDISVEKNEKKKLVEIKAYLALAKGEQAVKLGNNQEAINFFAEATKRGSIHGAEALLKAIEENKNHKHFFQNCALITHCVATAIGKEKSMLENDILKLTLSYDDDCLMKVALTELRQCQFEMEYNYLLSHQFSCMKIGIVINKARSILNYAVTMFKEKNYPNATNKEKLKDNCDFFIIHNSSADEVEKKIVKKLKKRGWIDFRNRFKNLLEFLVAIQPVIDPDNNNWLMALITLDNIQKHQHSLSLFKNRDGELVRKDVKIIEIARCACFHIRTIVDEFCKYCTPSESNIGTK